MEEPRNEAVGVRGRSLRARALFAALMVIPIVLIACGGDDDSSTSSDTGGTDAPAADLTQFTEAAESASITPTWEDIQPAESPAIAPDKKVMIIICTAEGSGCVLQGEGFAEAAEAVGWETTTIDGEGSSDVQSNAIRQAVTQGFDGIYLAVIDQRLIEDAMQDASDAGIPVVSSVSGNVPGTGPTEVTASVDAPDIQEGVELMSWAIDQEDGNVNAALFTLEGAAPVNINRSIGAREAMEACETCTIVADETYTFDTVEDLGLRVQSLARANPEMNYVYIEVGPFASFIVEGLRQLGSDGEDIKVVAFDCVPDQIERIKNDDFEIACDGYASVQAGWGAVDEMNRAFQGEEAGGDIVATQIFTKETIDAIPDPEGVGFDGGFDYRTEYLNLWGVQ